MGSRGDQIASLVDNLETAAEKSQRAVTAILAHESDAATPLFSVASTFWISNQVFIQDATAELLVKLLTESSIQEIREEAIFTLENPDVEIVPAISTSSNGSVAVSEANSAAWGVNKIGAVSVWGLGITGENVTVATIDTGVRQTHETLRDNFLGDFGWFDPITNLTAPSDAAGHGTHVTALIAGTKGIGVAPGANWMACKGCPTAETCTESAILACSQFVLCPTDPSGVSRDCSKAPRIVNNSWGTKQGDTTFSPVIQAWRKAGIIPIFANGNVVANCGTVQAPADNADVIGVGATNKDDSLLSYSATGPTQSGLLKPDVTAPGTSVYSAWRSRDNIYAITSGTSMAAPHAAGVAALLLSVGPNMTFDDVRSALTASASRNLTTTDRTCGGTVDSAYPNNIFGYGRIDALGAIASLNV